MLGKISKTITLNGLKKRGWTRKMIQEHLGDGIIVRKLAARTVFNHMHFSVIPEMVFREWDMDRVLEVEARSEISMYLVYKKISKINTKI